jgi:hypothetical protein
MKGKDARWAGSVLISSLGKDAKSVVLQSRGQAEEKKVYQKAEGKDLSTWVRETLNRSLNQ